MEIPMMKEVDMAAGPFLRWDTAAMIANMRAGESLIVDKEEQLRELVKIASEGVGMSDEEWEELLEKAIDRTAKQHNAGLDLDEVFHEHETWGLWNHIGDIQIGEEERWGLSIKESLEGGGIIFQYRKEYSTIKRWMDENTMEVMMEVVRKGKNDHTNKIQRILRTPCKDKETGWKEVERKFGGMAEIAEIPDSQEE